MVSRSTTDKRRKRKNTAGRWSWRRVTVGVVVCVVAACALFWLAGRIEVAGDRADAGAVPANYTVTPDPSGGFRVAVPFLRVEAWLPAEPTHHQLKESSPFGFQDVEELGVTVRELDFTGCGLSWYRAADATDAGSRLDEAVRGHEKRLWAELVESKDIRIAGHPAKESVMRMKHSPNVGTARVRHVLVDGWVVAMHTFRYKAVEPDATITRCLESLVVPPAEP